MIEDKRYIENSSLFLDGIKDCIPTILGYLSIGFACGVVSKSCGLSIFQTTAMSALIYAGSSQFIASSMIVSLASIPNIILAIFLVNLRYLLMSASIAPYFKNSSTIKNIISGILLTDETFALAILKGKHDNNINFKWMLGINIAAYLNWVLANFLGALLGSLIYNYKIFGLDFALPAMFIGLLISSIKQNNNKKHSFIIVFFAIFSFSILVIFFSTNTSIMISSILGALLGMVIEK